MTVLCEVHHLSQRWVVAGWHVTVTHATLLNVPGADLLAPSPQSGYLAELKQLTEQQPFIPLLMVHLGHLVGKHKERPDSVDGQLNVSKRQHVYSVLTLCLAGRTRIYRFKALPGVAALFDAAPRIESDRLLDEEAQRRAEEALAESRGGSSKRLLGAIHQWHSGAI